MWGQGSQTSTLMKTLVRLPHTNQRLNLSVDIEKPLTLPEFLHDVYGMLGVLTLTTVFLPSTLRIQIFCFPLLSLSFSAVRISFTVCFFFFLLTLPLSS